MEMTIKLDGLEGLESALGELTSVTAKRVVKRTLKESGESVARLARSLVRERRGHLRESIDVSDRLSASQAAYEDKASDVEMHIGPGSHPQAITEEFGKFNQEPHPYLTPAWEAEKDNTLDDIGARLWVETEKAAARARRRAGR